MRVTGITGLLSDILWQPASGRRAAWKGEENVGSREANCEPADL